MFEILLRIFGTLEKLASGLSPLSPLPWECGIPRTTVGSQAYFLKNLLLQQKTFQTVVVGLSPNTSYPTFLIYVLHQKMLGVWVWVEGCSLHVCDPPCSHGPLLSVIVATIPVESLYRERQVNKQCHAPYTKVLSYGQGWGTIRVNTRGGGVLNKVLYREARPRGPTPYPFIYHFGRKGTPFIYLLSIKGTPFTCLF